VAGDYDDEIHLPEPEPTAWDPLEWEDLRASRRFSAYVKIALRAAKRIKWSEPHTSHEEADFLYTLAQAHPDLWEYHEEQIWNLIRWIRDGASQPKPARLTLEQRVLRRAAIQRQRGRHGS